jgi:hypothetical protein
MNSVIVRRHFSGLMQDEHVLEHADVAFARHHFENLLEPQD